MDWIYGVEYRREEGQVQAVAVAAPEAIAFGSSIDEARREIREALDAAVRGRMKFRMDLAAPPKLEADDKRERIALAPELAAKASVYALWKASGLSTIALAESLGVNEKKAWRILDPDHATGLAHLARAAELFGHRLTVGARES